jgi:uncharacterized protein (TIGR03437 family)
MLAILTYTTNVPVPVVARTAVGALDRRFTLPIELSGISMSINGIACGLKSVSSNEITFVVPEGFIPTLEGDNHPFVVNNNGVVFRGRVIIVPSRPDVFTTTPPGPGGVADARNVTNTVHTTEPFTVRTLKIKGGHLVPTVLRLRATGIMGLSSSNMSIVIGTATIGGSAIVRGATQVEPGIFEVDFTVPDSLRGDGEQPTVIQVFLGGTTFYSRLADTAPKIRFL